MSIIPFSELKGPKDESLNPRNITLPFTTTNLIVDTITEYQAVVQEARIINRDTVNRIDYRTFYPTAPLKPVDPNSDENIDGWLSYIEVRPNAVTGTGVLELDLVPMEQAKRGR